MQEATAAATDAKHVFQIYIKTTPEKLWQALTDGDFTEKYYFGTRINPHLKAGEKYKYTAGEHTAIEGEVLEIDPPRKLVMSFTPMYSSAPADAPKHTSRVTYEIEAKDDICKLTLAHDQLITGDPTNEEFFGGWSKILSGLKTLLETGEAMEVG